MRSVSLKDLGLSSEESNEIVELLARKRGIKDYESTSSDRLLNALISSIPVRKGEIPKISKVRIGKVEREFKKLNHKLSKPIRDEIRRNLYEMKNWKNLFTLGIKKAEKSLDELESFLSRTQKYHDCDDAEYKGIKDIEGLFDLSIDEDYYKPIIVKSAFDNNCIMYESRGDKDKILTVNEYLDMIRPYLVDMINEHKPKSEWKIQLAAVINFISSKPDSNETPIMHTKSNNVEIMIGSDTNEVVEELLKSFAKISKKFRKKTV